MMPLTNIRSITSAIKKLYILSNCVMIIKKDICSILPDRYGQLIRYNRFKSSDCTPANGRANDDRKTDNKIRVEMRLYDEISGTYTHSKR